MAHPHIRGLYACATVVAALLVAGCHTAPDPTSSPAVPSTSVATSLADSEVTGLTAFTSPSGDVGCILDPTIARCDIAERSWAPPLRPADCAFDYGQGITLSPGRPAEFVCAGDTTVGTGAALADGDSVTAGPIRCESADSGVACSDSATGHGFSISREAYHLF